MSLFRLRSGAFALTLAALFAAIGAATALAAQGHMINARGYLYDSLAQLQVAIPDKAGHRAHAMTLVKQAINEVNLGIAAGAR